MTEVIKPIEELDEGYENCLDLPTIIPTKLTDFVDEEAYQEPEDESWKKHWVGMPEFKNDKEVPHKQLKINFRNEEDYQKFAKLIDQNLSEKTKSIWFPYMPKEQNSLMRWVEED